MKKKSGMFKLEPDKFSIHTFEISKKLTNQDYKKMRDRLYCRCPRGEMYQDRDWQGEGERFRCRWFQRNGLRISLEKDVHGQISTCYLRVAVNPRKLPVPPKYERAVFKSEDKRAANKYNKHHITLKRKTRELVVYDKTYQIVENGLLLDEEKLPKGVLRFEVHELRELISKAEKKLGTGSVASLLRHYVAQSEKVVTRCFGRAYPDEKFMQPDRLISLIYTEADTELRDGMVWLVKTMVRVKTLEKGIKKIEKEGYDTEAVLAQFVRLGVSPVPLRKNFCAETMMGVSVLLERIAHRSVRVWYK